ncbi:hypothetical protein BCF44_101190 [Kutzneria buriramensis]|uniref:Uncharacterized protein n=1 Tax=Kutzneria buriramensis TaxID=1045776 RepID=A0A3E0I8T2_9PSEU|nr:hypothetical protein BCF44_101190 [Kutzneria buriramensis]
MQHTRRRTSPHQDTAPHRRPDPARSAHARPRRRQVVQGVAQGADAWMSAVLHHGDAAIVLHVVVGIQAAHIAGFDCDSRTAARVDVLGHRRPRMAEDVHDLPGGQPRVVGQGRRRRPAWAPRRRTARSADVTALDDEHVHPAGIDLEEGQMAGLYPGPRRAQYLTSEIKLCAVDLAQANQTSERAGGAHPNGVVILISAQQWIPTSNRCSLVVLSIAAGLHGQAAARGPHRHRGGLRSGSHTPGLTTSPIRPS